MWKHRNLCYCLRIPINSIKSIKSNSFINCNYHLRYKYIGEKKKRRGKKRNQKLQTERRTKLKSCGTEKKKKNEKERDFNVNSKC